MPHFTTHSDVETAEVGRIFGKDLPPNSVLCFFGDLGAGKTTFIKGLVSGIGGLSHRDVSSPTFVYLNIYRGEKTVYHFDLYRLRDADEFLSMGFDEMFYAGGICCIEWSEKIREFLPDHIIRVEITHKSENIRHINIITS